MTMPDQIQVLDSHTEGEPTRVVFDGWPAPEGATMAERLTYVSEHQDALRRAVVLEPRGHDAIVGALLTPPVEPESTAGVIFFNNTGYLGMCGHGLIGVVESLSYLGRMLMSPVHIDTPVGTIEAARAEDGSVTFRNVPAYRLAADVALDVPGIGRVVGDVAWGGNWFFLTELAQPPIDMEHIDELVRVTKAMRAALDASDVRGEQGALIDHVELSGPPSRADADARNFVLCPGGQYDRSPCGTGTSAKMAVMNARGSLEPGSEWRQEGVAGGLFIGRLDKTQEGLVPTIRGRAYITAEAILRFHPDDPFRTGIPGPLDLRVSE